MSGVATVAEIKAVRIPTLSFVVAITFRSVNVVPVPAAMLAKAPLEMLRANPAGAAVML
jgi:hypothetical protein